MKKLYFTSLLAAICILGITACSDDKAGRASVMEESPEIEVSLKTPSGGLSCPFYIFRKQAGSADDYVFDNSIATVGDGSTMRIALEDLKAFDYRFLMVAQPASTPWLEVTGNGEPLIRGTAWNDVRLKEVSDSASDEAYFGITDMTGEAIISTPRIVMLLKRIAGEMVFDIYRRGTSIDDPVSVVSTDVASVIDRVTEIEIRYAGHTSSLRFGADNLPVPASYTTTETVQTIKPALDAAFRASLPQTESGLEEYGSAVRGGLRIMGAFLLPSDSRIRVTMKFTYYDTTPECGNNHPGEHFADCFRKKTVTLTLPAATASLGLPVKSDCFTVNRAALRTDRIIDVPSESSVDVDFAWK